MININKVNPPTPNDDFDGPGGGLEHHIGPGDTAYRCEVKKVNATIEFPYATFADSDPLLVVELVEAGDGAVIYPVNTGVYVSVSPEDVYKVTTDNQSYLYVDEVDIIGLIIPTAVNTVAPDEHNDGAEIIFCKE